MKKYTAYWGDSFTQKQVKLVDTSFFNENTGYEPEDISAIERLHVGETWISPEFSDHIVVCVEEIKLTHFYTHDQASKYFNLRYCDNQSMSNGKDNFTEDIHSVTCPQCLRKFAENLLHRAARFLLYSHENHITLGHITSWQQGKPFVEESAI